MRLVLVLALLAACGGNKPGAQTVPPRADVDVTDPAIDPAPQDSMAADPDHINFGDGAPAYAAVLVAAHNRYRARHCAPPLVWSPEVAAVAQKWADHLAASNCAFEHSGGALGENLAAGTTGQLSPERVVEMWYGEVEGYAFGRGGFSMETGHFTQVVWKGTQRLGCGVVACHGMDVYVCNYDPAGNWQGQYEENVLPACK